MKFEVSKIQQALTCYDLRLSSLKIKSYLKTINHAQLFFPIEEQHALLIKLIHDWEDRRDEKIFTATSEACHLETGPFVTTFGVLSVDWPGLSDTCMGIIHEMGWNIYFIKGISLEIHKENLGIILIGIRTDDDGTHNEIVSQAETILTKIRQAAIGTRAKTSLITEEIRKLEIYSQVIGYIEKIYQGKDIDKIIGFNGEAVKYFAARSRDYIENRKIEDIAMQIILNFTFIKRIRKTGRNIRLNIGNFKTETEGTFTGLTVSGPAHMLNLEDCLKTIELTSSNFQLKHNREFTTEDGIAVYRIEFVDSSNHPLSILDQQRLKKNFQKLVLNKRQDRAQWIESIGGFEQYARAIIPLLVKEAQSTNKTQVYQAVGNATELFIEFKVIVVVPNPKESGKKLVNQTVNLLEAVDSIHIISVKPPKKFGVTDVFIIDLRINLSDVENMETIYKIIREKIHNAVGDFRDFDEGMRNIDIDKLKAVRQRMNDVNKTLIRELYYSIEDFYRVSATEDEIIGHIQIGFDMLNEIDKSDESVLVLTNQTGCRSQCGEIIPTATLICISYPHRDYLLPKILEILEPYEVTLSRLEKVGRDILICRVTKQDKVLNDENTRLLAKSFLALSNKVKA